MTHNVFISGATGYLGRNLIPKLLERNHSITALARPGSETRVPIGCRIVTGNALDASTLSVAVAPADTFIHLVGVPHPSPAKAELFRSIDLPAVKASIEAATQAAVRHFIYLSVAHPASIMKAYVQTRIEAEEMIRAAGLRATFVRPWYVLGPGHRWAYVLMPFYKVFELIPATRESALRLGLVTLPQMIGALIAAVENAANEISILDVPRIRQDATHAVGARRPAS